ncbi:hypothetical protein HAX54_006195 [Datura stramonium]|uniref:Uncharacterized protein n=1 Tax=Datura stramonium TaxID=4076 RepID=A0ABS8TBK3_DATST|nr:hypothetical protein [Datura stramonium]
MEKGKGKGRGRPRKMQIPILKVGTRGTDLQADEGNPVTPILMEQCLPGKTKSGHKSVQTVDDMMLDMRIPDMETKNQRMRGRNRWKAVAGDMELNLMERMEGSSPFDMNNFPSLSITPVRNCFELLTPRGFEQENTRPLKKGGQSI